MKYHKNPPIITITKYDVELVAEKVQDRGEDVVCTKKAQREEIMEKIVEVHDILHRLQVNTMHHSTMQQTKKNMKHMRRKSNKRPGR